jgi:putative flippase GtrA
MLCFGVVGIAGFLVNAGIVEAMAHPIGPGWAQLLAFPVAASVTWWLNRRYTFGASRNSWQLEWMRYLASNLVGWSANNGAYFSLIFSYSFVYQHPAIAVATGSLAGMVFNFIFSKRFVFGRS